MRSIVFALGVCFLIPAPALAAPAEKEVLAAMDTWKQAMIKKDRGALDKVLHSDLSYGHASGKVETKAEAIDHVVKADGGYTNITFADTKVNVQGKTAVVSGKVDYLERAHGKEGIVNLVVLSVWTKGPQGWQMLARQSTKPPPPAAATAAAVPAKAPSAPATK